MGVNSPPPSPNHGWGSGSILPIGLPHPVPASRCLILVADRAFARPRDDLGLFDGETSLRRTAKVVAATSATRYTAWSCGGWLCGQHKGIAMSVHSSRQLQEALDEAIRDWRECCGEDSMEDYTIRRLQSVPEYEADVGGEA